MSVSKALPIGLTSCDLIPQQRAAHCTPGGVRRNKELSSIDIPPLWGGGKVRHS